MVIGKHVSGPEVIESGQLAVCFHNYGLSERPRNYMIRGLPAPANLESLGREFSVKTTLVVPDGYGIYQDCLQQVVNTIKQTGKLSSVTVWFQEQDERNCPAGLHILVEPLDSETPWNQLSRSIETALQALIRTTLNLSEETEVPIRRFASFRMRPSSPINWGIEFSTIQWCEVESFEQHETYVWRKLS